MTADEEDSRNRGVCRLGFNYINYYSKDGTYIAWTSEGGSELLVSMSYLFLDR